MKNRIVKGILLLTLSGGLLSFNMPEGWFKAGSEPENYEMGMVEGIGQHGDKAATIKSAKKKVSGFGTLMQQCKPDKYLGKRVKLTGYMKSENVKGWAGFWFRVDQAISKRSLSFDNMGNRPVKGTTDWTMYEIILDVPENASALAFGALLDGTGQIWFDNLTFEIVSDSIETTDLIKRKGTYLNEPGNLDFED